PSRPLDTVARSQVQIVMQEFIAQNVVQLKLDCKLVLSAVKIFGRAGNHARFGLKPHPLEGNRVRSVEIAEH
ncbi:hypothetical protein, partial [Agrobacterium vitis]|uniref:hypothetical protein n=1 Tax=Agrobacterium vitis TaxID=373 RepID=UPI001AEDD60B